MEVILKSDVENLGYKDDMVTVKNGYGLNYLIPPIISPQCPFSTHFIHEKTFLAVPQSCNSGH